MKEKLKKLYLFSVTYIEWIAHFAVSYMIADFFNNPFLAVGIVIAINLIKEILGMKLNNSKFDIKDVIAGTLGGLFNILITYLHDSLR